MSAEHTLAAGGPGVAQLYAVNKAASPWVPGSLVKTYRVTNQTQFAVDGTTRIWTITIANEEDSAAFNIAMKNGLPVTQAVGTMAQRTRESGTVVGGEATGGVDYILLVGGPVGDEGDDVNRKLTIAYVNFDPTTGGWTQVANTPSNKSLAFKTVKNDEPIEVGFATINDIPDENGTTDILYEKASGVETLAEGLGLDEFWVTAYTP